MDRISKLTKEQKEAKLLDVVLLNNGKTGTIVYVNSNNFNMTMEDNDINPFEEEFNKWLVDIDRTKIKKIIYVAK